MMSIARAKGFDSVHEARKYLRKENRRFGARLVELKPEHWPKLRQQYKNPPIAVWRSRDFLVQVCREKEGRVRLAITRTDLTPKGHWKDGITWDELQRIKREVGYGDRDAVEVFPADGDHVNVANVPHLWILPEPLPWKWKRGSSPW